MSGKWKAFKSELMRVQGQHVPVRPKGKAGRDRERWITRVIEALVLKEKKEAYDMYRQLGSSKFYEAYRGCQSLFKREIRKTKRRHEMALADKVKENPKRSYKYMKGKKRVTKKVDDISAVDIVYMESSKAFDK
eukprot:g35688.t1